jgi:oligogalacturonide lyase
LVVLAVIVCAVATGQSNSAASATAPATQPTSWIDKDTGHRVIRLTDQPGSRGLYFNSTAFTPDGKQMAYIANSNIYMVDLHTRKSSMLASGPVSAVVVSQSAPIIYYMKSKDQRVFAADISTGELRQVAVLPDKAIIRTINSDGTLLAGDYIDASDAAISRASVTYGVRPSKKARERARFDAHLPMVLFTIDLRTSVVMPILHTTDWIAHVQFSPTDPTLLMYCHEGPWNEVERIWTIRADGSSNTLIHKRSLEMKKETAGHEFWDSDGKTVWYDLQAPKGQSFFLASYNTETGEQRRYQMDRSQWSIHFNGDLKSGIFCGDGASWFGAASSADGQWIELYRPRLTVSSDSTPNGTVKMGVIESERLVNLSNQDYNDEPNVHFSPDHKYVIFTSNMFGADYVFAVEVARTAGFKANAANTHVFSPSIVDSQQTDPENTIQVVDQANLPLANALVIVKSLDTGRQVGQYITGQEGKTPPIVLDKDLHRITVICPNGTCGNTIKEVHTAPFPGNMVIRALASSTHQGYVAISKNARVVVQDSNGNALPKIELLVRTADAGHEQWYETNGNGSASVTLLADPSIVTVFVKWTPYVFRFASVCGSTDASKSDGLECVQIDNTVVLTIPRI